MEYLTAMVFFPGRVRQMAEGEVIELILITRFFDKRYKASNA